MLTAVLVLLAGALSGAAGWVVGRRLQLERLTRELHVVPAETPADLAEELRRQQARAEEEHRSDERLVEQVRSALDEVTQGVLIVDERGRDLVVNRFAQAFVGARHGEALVEEAVRELLAEALSGRAAEQEVELFGPPRRTIAVSAQPLRPGGDLAGGVVLIDDVTEQHRLDAVRRDFVANVSHELRTPVGAVGLLADTLVGETDPNVIDVLSRRLGQEIARLTRLIDDLLDLSRVDAADVRGAAHDLAEMVADAESRVASLAERHRIAIDRTRVETGVRLWCDRAQIVSAVQNLLENAVKYSDDGTVVTVGASTDDGWVDLTVVDRGIGIPPGDLDRIFERFYRVDRGRSRSTGGTGLGLSIVKRVAANHGGSVTVSSREGAGSTFTMTLPLQAGAVVALVADRED